MAQSRSSASVQPRVRTQQPVRTEQTAPAQSSTPVQPSTSTGLTTYQAIPVGTSAGRTAFQMASAGPRRIIPRPVGPADDDQIQENPARRGSAFPQGYRFPEGTAFKVRRDDKARAWDIEPSRAYVRHALVEANDSDWEEPEQPWNSVPAGRYEGKLRTFTTSNKKFPGNQFTVGLSLIHISEPTRPY